MDQHTRERRFARCSQLWDAATNFRRYRTHQQDQAARRDRIKTAAVHAVANLVHAAIATGVAVATWQNVTIRHVPISLTVVGAFLLAVIALDRPFAWITDRLTTTPQPATTGPEFAKRHHHDSSQWSAADFETAYNLAEMDAQPAWTALTTKPATTLTPAA